MDRWTAFVLALETSQEEMVSRLPACLHPVAGRPLVWHTVRQLAGLRPAPESVYLLTAFELDDALFSDVGIPVEVSLLTTGERMRYSPPTAGRDPVLVLDASSSVPQAALQRLTGAVHGAWLGDDSGGVAAARLRGDQAAELLRLAQPLRAPHGLLATESRLPTAEPVVCVRDRVRLALATRRVRDALVEGHQLAGVTFLLPETVIVDVDVRIGSDTVVYAGVTLEGQTTIGEETVLGPGCRVIDSWIGSGVELKGWNYVSHTSIRNRAILEPNVRRGFD
jgi:bifunctional N-acetylglucosamine-1-phosphate-uridyltransferase/glucosamine-1-phosphate-acetyltransferase GlmU-like protein